jgi:hypothetical protein
MGPEIEGDADGERSEMKRANEIPIRENMGCKVSPGRKAIREDRRKGRGRAEKTRHPEGEKTEKCWTRKRGVKKRGRRDGG